VRAAAEKVTRHRIGTGRIVMPVAIYLELADGRIIRIGSVLMKGSATINKQIALRGLKDPPKRALINYNYDVLSE